ncbi:MAG TPA: hypothetical protein VMX17_12785 [Candidatus Glassbacteria bacterium]|nr:hypothetical protein [Candidatus Glassbacteria bacterium]
MTKEGIEVQKSFKPNFKEIVDNFVDHGGECLIFHCRYSTSGDFKDMNNNMPIVVGNTAIALNGIISMKRKKGFEKEFKVKCLTENDAEIILAKGNTPTDYVNFLKKNPKASFAGLFLHHETIYAIRNNKRPMYYFVTKRKSEFFVSTIDIAVRAGFKNYNKIKPIRSMTAVMI